MNSTMKNKAPLAPINTEARKSLSSPATSPDYDDPNYSEAIRIIDHLRGNGFLKNRPDTFEAVKVTMRCLRKREVVIQETTLSRDLLDLEYKKLALQNAKLAQQKECSKQARLRREATMAHETSVDKAFRDVAVKMLSREDWRALTDMAKELSASRQAAYAADTNASSIQPQ